MSNRNLDIETGMKRQGAPKDISKPRRGAWVKYSPHSLLAEPTLRRLDLTRWQPWQALPLAAAHHTHHVRELQDVVG